ncbi:MAG: hypothetical protein EAZ81_02975 [Verrucomicrobia bacterium]|jgi:hypothetical protein|nr:MAG: hypothetical protein EAZ81_02975 [Verrucomicrobiota bacterium]
MGAPIKADSRELARKKHQKSMTFHHSSRKPKKSTAQKSRKIKQTAMPDMSESCHTSIRTAAGRFVERASYH